MILNSKTNKVTHKSLEYDKDLSKQANRLIKKKNASFQLRSMMKTEVIENMA